MRTLFIYLSVFIIFLSCDENGPGTQETPERVAMVLKWPGCDMLEYEPGIDPVQSHNDTLLQIMWYSHPQAARLSEFRIYRSTDPEGKVRYSHRGTVKVTNPSAQDTVFIDSGIKINERNSYFVTAVGSNGRESLPSDTVYYTLIEQAYLIHPPDGAEIESLPITFRWDYAGSIKPHKYILRIEQNWDIDYHPLVYVKIVQGNYGRPTTHEVGAEPFNSNVTGISYRWRVDCIGDDELTKGSESNWHEFFIK
jgi:hypothetical protein